MHFITTRYYYWKLRIIQGFLLSWEIPPKSVAASDWFCRRRITRIISFRCSDWQCYCTLELHKSALQASSAILINQKLSNPNISWRRQNIWENIWHIMRIAMNYSVFQKYSLYRPTWPNGQLKNSAVNLEQALHNWVVRFNKMKRQAH